MYCELSLLFHADRKAYETVMFSRVSGQIGTVYHKIKCRLKPLQAAVMTHLRVSTSLEYCADGPPKQKRHFEKFAVSPTS